MGIDVTQQTTTTAKTTGTQTAPAEPGEPTSFDLASLYEPAPEAADAPAELTTRDSTETRRAFGEIKRVIVGQDRLIERLLVAMLARGHILLEGVPGLAKTLAIKTVAQVVGCTFRRIQFTPDLVPADLVGTRIFNQRTGEFSVELGPVFAHLLLADEINRAPAKVQSALLEVMQEHQVTIGGQTFAVPDPFLVLATQNPIEHEGTYQLPEAQVDRFMFKTVVGYPSLRDELTIVERATALPPVLGVQLTAARVLALQREADAVSVDPQLRQYAVYLVTATRQPEMFDLAHLKRLISFGASPRASINLILGARALALLRGRRYVLPNDVWSIAPDVLRHRLILSYEALAENVAVEDIVDQIIRKIPLPHLGLEGEERAPHEAERILKANTNMAAPSSRRWPWSRRRKSKK